MKSEDRFKKEEKFASDFVKKYPFLKKMWEERERIFGEAHEKESRIEAKYSEMAKRAGLKSVKFAYNEYCFGIDVNDVNLYHTDIKKNRLVIHEFTLNEDDKGNIYDTVKEAKRHIAKL